MKKDDLHRTRFEDSEPPALEPGQVLLGIDSFGLTTNNITYALLGETMRYWDFFPAEEGWGRLPVWGFAAVVASEAEGVPKGTRVYGYLPPSSHLVVRPDRRSETAFVDASPHRASLPPAYNRYLRVDGDAAYDERSEDHQILLWPLYITSFLIDDFLAEAPAPGREAEESGRGPFWGAELALLSSASSRTTGALAYLLAKRGGIEVVGLTSPGNVAFTEGLGVYDRVVPYEELTSIEPVPALYVDVAGDARIRSAVHGHWGDALRHSAAVGITHKGDLGGSGELAGPKPVFFFAPERLRKRTKDWGPESLNERIVAAWRPYVEWTRGWLGVEHGSGPEEIERVYLELLDGKSDPAVGHVLSPGD